MKIDKLKYRLFQELCQNYNKDLQKFIYNLTRLSSLWHMGKSSLGSTTDTPVTGGTPDVKRYIKSGKYIDICGSKTTGKIISYGTV